MTFSEFLQLKSPGTNPAEHIDWLNSLRTEDWRELGEEYAAIYRNRVWGVYFGGL